MHGIRGANVSTYHLAHSSKSSRITLYQRATVINTVRSSDGDSISNYNVLPIPPCWHSPAKSIKYILSFTCYAFTTACLTIKSFTNGLDLTCFQRTRVESLNGRLRIRERG